MNILDTLTGRPGAASVTVSADAAPAHTRQPDVLQLAVADLRPGLHVELDLGWLDHPFSSNKFKLRDAEQIATLVRIGLDRVRVRIDLSDADVVAVVVATLAHVTAAAPTSAPAATVAAAAANPAASGEAVTGNNSATVRRQRLAAQRRSLIHSDRLHGETVRAWQGVARDAVDAPQRAGQAAITLADRLVAEIGEDVDASVRVLHEAGGSSNAQHAVNVTVLALLLARQIGLDPAQQRAVALGALLHDVGKLALPDTLRNAGTDQPALALRARRDHVVQGVRLGTAMGLDPIALRVIAQHHELQDGSGLPQGLRGDDIVLPARIIALIDRYDRLCNPLGGGAQRTPHEAQSVLYAQMRAQLDPTLLAAFVKVMGVYPPGSVVQLTDGRYALVVAVHPAHPLKPAVLVQDIGVPRDEALILHLHEHAQLGIRRSLHAQHLPRATLDYLAPCDRLSYYVVHGLHSLSTDSPVPLRMGQGPA
jgi:putative nucleotidyltransferase with HDIG domain